MTDWLTEATATRDLSRINPSMAEAGTRINSARRHIQSARLIAETDTNLAIAACHDAIRKAVAGHMAANGLRVRRGEGAHSITLKYAEHQLADVISEEDLVDASNIRKDRNIAEYGDFPSIEFDAAHIRVAADVAERIVNAVANALASGTSRTGG